MTAVPILMREVRWYCPNCDITDVTRRADVHIRGHLCGGLSGLYAPLVQVGTSAKVEAVTRGDYVGAEIVTYDENSKPIMSVVTTRDDGQDCQVFVPAAGAHIT